MFQIDRAKNRLQRLEKPTFAEVGFREREHLQEWLATMPEALAEPLREDLLIIQKEFDGFDGTRERLDLLALDKTGQLVVIENKLDDSGRDVVWQALKYAAYCSSLKKAEIVGIFQHYLDRHGSGDAASAICDFLEETNLDEVVLNEGNDQRIVFIAANFRREVTATVLWLREHQIDARCIKVIPYRLGDQHLIDLQQVIPTPEAADYMIRMAEKESEEKSAQGAQRKSHQLRLAFWERALGELRNRGLSRYQNLSPSKDNWIATGTGVSNCHYSLVFLRDQARAELVLQRPEATENKRIFDELLAQKAEIESEFGGPLNWNRLDDIKRCSIDVSAAFDGRNSENWDDIIAWMSDSMRRLEKSFQDRLTAINTRLRSGVWEPTADGDTDVI